MARWSAQRASNLRVRSIFGRPTTHPACTCALHCVFRMRGNSREQLNLRSANWKNDLLAVLVVLAIGCLMDLTGPNFLQLTPHQRVAGGLLSFVVHLFLTDLPVMILIYGILLPRYARLVSPASAFLLGAASYPAIHIFETFT